MTSVRGMFLKRLQPQERDKSSPYGIVAVGDRLLCYVADVPLDSEAYIGMWIGSKSLNLMEERLQTHSYSAAKVDLNCNRSKGLSDSRRWTFGQLLGPCESWSSNF